MSKEKKVDLHVTYTSLSYSIFPFPFTMAWNVIREIFEGIGSNPDPSKTFSIRDTRDRQRRWFDSSSRTTFLHPKYPIYD